MSWKNLQNQGLVAPHTTSKAELDDLRAAIQRNLEDAAVEKLSDDNRFGIAYQAALIAAKTAILAPAIASKALAHITRLLRRCPLRWAPR